MSNVNIQIDISKSYEECITEAVKKTIHLVCIASTKESSYCLRLYRDLAPEIEFSQIAVSIGKVNQTKEVGCLYPYSNLSLIPAFDDKSSENENILAKNIAELIFEANERYIKSTTLVFLLDDPMINYNNLSVAIDKVISDKSLSESGKKLKWLKSIILR